MKRTCKFVIFIAIFLLLCGARLNSASLLAFCPSFLKYAQYGVKQAQSVCNGYERVDFEGGEDAAKELVAKLNATLIMEESIAGAKILYYYSPILYKQERVKGERINLMIAVRGDKVAAGSPLLKGSF